MTGMLTVREFAQKIGASNQTVTNWILLNRIPFKVGDSGQRLIPEFEAMESPIVKTFVPRVYTPRPGKPQAALVAPEVPIKPEISLKHEAQVDREEKLFLIARQQAQGFIARARNCKSDRKHEAEAELLWMAVECFGFKP